MTASCRENTEGKALFKGGCLVQMAPQSLDSPPPTGLLCPWALLGGDANVALGTPGYYYELSMKSLLPKCRGILTP